MADNFLFTPGSGATGASDDISSVHYPRHKVIIGADGSNDGDIHRENGLPVADSQALTCQALVTKAYTFFTGSHQTLSLVAVDTSATVLIRNATDGVYIGSWDAGTTDHFIVGPNMWRRVRIKAGATACHMKYSTAPTSGNVYFEVEA